MSVLAYMFLHEPARMVMTRCAVYIVNNTQGTELTDVQGARAAPGIRRKEYDATDECDFLPAGRDSGCPSGRCSGALGKLSNAPGNSGTTGVDPAEIAMAVGERAPNSLRSLLSRARRANYDQRDILYHQGDASDSVFFITHGLLKLVIHLRNGRARIVRLHRAGAVLGLNRVLKKGNEHTAVGITPVSALRLPLKMVRQLRDEDPTSYLNLVERWDGYLEDAVAGSPRFPPVRSADALPAC